MARDKYQVLRSDPVLPVDVPVRRCRTRAEARALAAELNRRVAAACGRPRPGRPTPLYFVERG